MDSREILTAEQCATAGAIVHDCRDDLFSGFPDLVSIGVAVKRTGNLPTGEPCVQLGVRRKVPDPEEYLPVTIDDTPTDVVQVGEIFGGPGRPLRHHGTDHGTDAVRLAKAMRRGMKDRGPIAAGLLEDLLDLLQQFCGERPPPRTGRFRPVPPGVSVGHVDITAGTAGLWVKDRDSGENFLLSSGLALAEGPRDDVKAN